MVDAHIAKSTMELPDIYRQTTYTLRRKVLKLFDGAFRLHDARDNVVGYSQMKAFKLKEDIRLYTGGEVGGISGCTFKQHFNPFVLKMTLDFARDRNALLDRWLGLAAAILLCAIEGRQR